MNSHICFILVETENPDNIGAAARAMKNMGFADLRLVRPPAGWRKKAKKMAMSANDVLEKASVYRSLQKAVADRQLVIGTTRRNRKRIYSFIPFQEAMQQAVTHRKGTMAFVFGKESKGLDNASLDLCDVMTTIPTQTSFASVNLAQAVMIISFAVFEILNGKQYTGHVRARHAVPLEYVPQKDVHEALQRFRKALTALGYDKEKGDVTDRIVATLRDLLKRNRLLPSEAQMLKGLSRRICEKVK